MTDEDPAPLKTMTAGYVTAEIAWHINCHYGLAGVLDRYAAYSCDQFMVKARSWRVRPAILTPHEFRLAGGISPHGMPTPQRWFRENTSPRRRPHRFDDTQGLLSANLLSEIKS